MAIVVETMHRDFFLPSTEEAAEVAKEARLILSRRWGWKVRVNRADNIPPRSEDLKSLKNLVEETKEILQNQ